MFTLQLEERGRQMGPIAHHKRPGAVQNGQGHCVPPAAKGLHVGETLKVVYLRFLFNIMANTWSASEIRSSLNMDISVL